MIQENKITPPENPTPARAEMISNSLGARHPIADHLRHLENFDPGDEIIDDAQGVAEEITTAGFVVPETIAATLAAMAEINGQPRVGGREGQIREAKLRKLRAHHHFLCQSPVPPPINYGDFLKPHVPAVHAIDHLSAKVKKI